MPAIQFIDSPLSAEQIGDLMFAGDILIFTQVPPLLKACAVADPIVRQVLGDADPLTAEQRLEPAEFLQRARNLQKHLFGQGNLEQLMREALLWTGLPAEDTCWDMLQVRTMPSQASHHGRRVSPLAPHRDTWGSNLMAQINWWSPLYPIAATRTIGMYFDYWHRPVANDSADWDFWELKRLMQEGRGHEYPLLPTVTELLPENLVWSIVMRPGDLMCFSSAHLHKSLTDDSGITRFSLETRTVNLSHCRSGHGAPNLDGRAPRVMPEWFTRMSDGASMACLLPE